MQKHLPRSESVFYFSNGSWCSLFGDLYMGDKQQFLSFFKGPDTKASELEDTYVKDDIVSRAGGVNILTWHLFFGPASLQLI